MLESSRTAFQAPVSNNSAQMEMIMKQRPLEELPKKTVDLSQYAVVNNGCDTSTQHFSEEQLEEK